MKCKRFRIRPVLFWIFKIFATGIFKMNNLNAYAFKNFCILCTFDSAHLQDIFMPFLKRREKFNLGHGLSIYSNGKEKKN